MLDSLVVILLVFMGLRDDRRSPGQPHTSLFRTRDVDAHKVEVRPLHPAWAWESTDRDDAR